MKLTIIVPVLDEQASVARRLAALAGLRDRGARVVLVDGGSTDGTLQARDAQGRAVSELVDEVMVAPRGRAAQMNAGARGRVAREAEVLLFLHADTTLPPRADERIVEAVRAGALWGRFDVRIDSPRLMLRVVSLMMNLRSRLSGIATGDQAIFVRRRVFEAAGGWPCQPLMEDIALSESLRRIAPPACLRDCVLTSARRWERHGLWRTIVLMWRLRLAWALGADAHALALRYGYRPRAPAAVAVLAKAPVAGLAKTRLIPRLGAAGAARAQRGFTLRTIDTARAASTGPLTLWCAPDRGHRLFRALATRLGVSLRDQPAGDLGQRMAHVVQTHFETRQDAPPVLLIGTDCPVLDSTHLQRAADELTRHDAVLIPAEDGGYVLIGLRRPLPQVFTRIDWSTPRVLTQTRERLREIGASWSELPTLWDVDEPADWQRLTELAVSASLAEPSPPPSPSPSLSSDAHEGKP